MDWGDLTQSIGDPLVGEGAEASEVRREWFVGDQFAVAACDLDPYFSIWLGGELKVEPVQTGVHEVDVACFGRC